MEKPSNLPNMEIIKDSSQMGKSRGGGGPGGRMGGPGMGMNIGGPIGGDLFNMPGYVKPTISRVSDMLQNIFLNLPPQTVIIRNLAWQ